MPIGGVVVFVVKKEKSPVTSFHTTRRKPVSGLPRMSKELQVEGVYAKNDREEAGRREQAKLNREQLIGQVPDAWLRMA